MGRALSTYAAIGDEHGQADAIHLQGLIEFHRQNLDAAQTLFDQSMNFDIAAGERTFFRGEYERHVGYIAYQRNDIASAVQHFENSLEARIDAGAIDASLFAAISLASALIKLERLNEAKSHLDYALDIAQQINSPVGINRATAVMKQLSEVP